MIVVSVLERDFSVLRAQALAQVPFADLIELRLDHVGDPGGGQLEELVRALDKPVIAAVNGPESHGWFRAGREERFTVLASAARAGAAFVDVDWKDARLQGPLPATCRRIVSRHELDALADPSSAWVELAATARTTDTLKLVAHAHCAEDGVRMLQSVRAQERPVIGFSSGPAGSFTRVLAPIFGSQWTYAAPANVTGVPEGNPSAPGQLRADVLRALWPECGPSRNTAVFGVLGNPARHSLSPRLHGACLRAAGLDAVYVAIEPADFAEFIALCRSPAWSGFSVTAPFKELAFAHADMAGEDAQATQAANTLVRGADGAWSGHNTDVPAVRAIVEQAGTRLSDAHVVVIGTGGSARAALVAMRAARRVTVAGRDAGKRAALAREFDCAACSLDEIAGLPWSVLIHCTPLGSRARPDGIAIDPDALRPGTLVVDAVYRPARTPLLVAAARAGASTVPGSEWFIEQAVRQFELFTRRACDPQRMRAEMHVALAEDEG